MNSFKLKTEIPNFRYCLMFQTIVCKRILRINFSLSNIWYAAFCMPRTDFEFV